MMSAARRARPRASRSFRARYRPRDVTGRFVLRGLIVLIYNVWSSSTLVSLLSEPGAAFPRKAPGSLLLLGSPSDGAAGAGSGKQKAPAWQPGRGVYVRGFGWRIRAAR